MGAFVRCRCRVVNFSVSLRQQVRPESELCQSDKIAIRLTNPIVNGRNNTSPLRQHVSLFSLSSSGSQCAYLNFFQCLQGLGRSPESKKRLVLCQMPLGSTREASPFKLPFTFLLQ